MKKNSKIRAMKLAGLVTALVIMATGVAYAALQSQQIKLTGNTIQTASANLLLSTDGTTYASTLTGYSFSGLVPGGPAVPAGGQKIYIKNTGNAPLSLRMFVGSTPINPDSVDLSKVSVIITPISGGTAQTATLQSLISSQATGGITLNTPASLASGSSTGYNLSISMTADAINGASASISGIDFIFTGVATI